MRSIQSLLRYCFVAITVLAVHQFALFFRLERSPIITATQTTIATNVRDTSDQPGILSKAQLPRRHGLFNQQDQQRQKCQSLISNSTRRLPLVQVLEHGVAARSFEPWPENKSLPCFPSIKDFTTPASLPTNQGFLFMKLMKTGGSTAASIHVRITKHIAEREKKSFHFCKGRWDHAWGYEILPERDREQSFTWTIIRDPTKRAISHYFHFEFSRKGGNATDESFQEFLASDRKVLKNYYLQLLSKKRLSVTKRNAAHNINRILADYDFIAITERMDESAVALMMLLRLKMSDILFLNSKESGSYDEGGFDGRCQLIQKSTVSEAMKGYFRSDGWHAVVEWDNFLYRAANLSLDLTIDHLGKEAFAKNLARFRHAQKVAQERCIATEPFPCTSDGKRNNHKDCLWKDSGCGWRCLDEIATELDLL